MVKLKIYVDDDFRENFLKRIGAIKIEVEELKEEPTAEEIVEEVLRER